MLHTDWRDYGYCTNPIDGFILISGIYDLSPIVQTYVNTPLKLTSSSAIQESPIFQNFSQSIANCQILIVVAENDSPAFHQQAKEYYEYLKDSSKRLVLLKIPQTDHFNIIELLISEEYSLSKFLVNFINFQCLNKEIMLFF